MLARLIHRPRCWRRTTLVLLPLLAALLLIGSLEADWDFGRITKLAEKRYGPLGSARFRLNDWQELLRVEADAPVGDKLQAVNLFFRNSRYYSFRLKSIMSFPRRSPVLAVTSAPVSSTRCRAVLLICGNRAYADR